MKWSQARYFLTHMSVKLEKSWILLTSTVGFKDLLSSFLFNTFFKNSQRRATLRLPWLRLRKLRLKKFRNRKFLSEENPPLRWTRPQYQLWTSHGWVRLVMSRTWIGRYVHVISGYISDSALVGLNWSRDTVHPGRVVEHGKGSVRRKFPDGYYLLAKRTCQSTKRQFGNEFLDNP